MQILCRIRYKSKLYCVGGSSNFVFGHVKIPRDKIRDCECATKTQSADGLENPLSPTLCISTALGLPRYLSSSQTCLDLCSSCNGIASFANDRCECNIGDNSNEEADCLLRMRREAEVHGMDSMSCDLSNDRRSTRCTLGFSHKFGEEDYRQLANYFMNDGPRTGSIFVAPPYTNKEKSSDFVKPSQVITQPPETLRELTYPVTTEKVPSTPPTKKASAKSKDCVRASQAVTQPKNTLPSSQTSRANLELDAISSPQTSDNDSGQISVIQFTPGPNTPLIQITPGSKGPIIGAINPNTLTGSARHAQLAEAWGPSILEFFSRQFSPPLLGIPQAIKTVTETPGISELVSVPGNFINSLMQRWSNKFSRQNGSDGAQSEAKESATEAQESEDRSSDPANNNAENVDASSPSAKEPENNDENSNVRTQSIQKEANNQVAESQGSSRESDNNNSPNGARSDSSTNAPQFNYINTNMGSPFFGMMNPTLGSAAPTHLSYFPQIPAFSAMPMMHNPVINGLSPYNSYIPHIPSPAYILSSSLSIPLVHHFNTEFPSSNFYQSATNVDDLSKNTNDKFVGQSKADSNANSKQKKNCKKSNKE